MQVNFHFLLCVAADYYRIWTLVVDLGGCVLGAKMSK